MKKRIYKKNIIKENSWKKYKKYDLETVGYMIQNLC